MFTYPVTLLAPGSTPDLTTFNITVNTNLAGSASDTFILPTAGSGTYNYSVDWGDTNVDTVVVSTSQTHIYDAPGIYNIKISGVFPRIFFNNAGDKAKITDISQWGNIAWSSMANAFYGCTSLTNVSATDAPDLSNVTAMRLMFRDCSGLTTLNVSGWNTGSVTDMSDMFRDCSSLTTLDVSLWNTGLVTTMTHMFRDCSSLTTLDVSLWNTGLVKTMSFMFHTCTSLTTLDVSLWNTGSVTTMRLMFFGCSSLTALDVSGWNTGLVTNMTQMFRDCSSLDPDVSGWDITSLTNAASMMSGSGFSTTNYNLLLPAWDAQSVLNNVSFHGGSAQYSAGAPATARANLIANHTWTIVDGGPA
jgi:surface protein